MGSRVSFTRRRASTAMVIRFLLGISGLMILAACGGSSSTTTTTTGTPAATLSASSLTFTTSQTAGTSSTAQTVTVTDSGTATLSFTGFAPSGNFSETNTCGAGIGAGAACTISVTFTPPAGASGTLTGTLTITDNASPSTQTVTLSGTAVAPTIAITGTGGGTISSFTFPSQAAGTNSSAQSATITAGTTTLVFSSIAVTAGASDFTEPNNCLPSIAAGASCTISVTFTPPAGASGTLTGTLTITDNASATPQTLSLTGTAVVPTISVSPSSLTFASQTVGIASAAQPVTVTNTGTVPASITSIAIAGTNPGGFAQTNTCGTTVAAGANCAISVTFTPTATGTRTATLTITDNASGSPQTVSLTGTGAVPTVSISPASLSLTFASTAVGASSPSQPVTVTNTGTVPALITGISVTAGSSDFTQTSTCGASVSVGANCTINVVFTPSTSGTRNGTLTITDNATGSPQTVSLTGTGAASVVSLSTTSLTFSSQTVGIASATQAVTVTNTGTVALTFASIAASGDFTETNNCPPSTSSLNTGLNCAITVTFTPTATGTRTGAITITDNAGGVANTVQTVALTGTGAVPLASASPSSLTFLPQLVGVASASQPVTLNNTGTVPVAITSILASGDFSQTTTCGASVSVGGSCTINVIFTPTATGTRNGTLTITDNAGNSPQTVSLTGTGAVPTVSITPSNLSLTFGSITVGTPGGSQLVTLNNTGSVSLSITSIVVTAGSSDFSETNTCDSSVPPVFGCTIGVAFTPSASGTRTGTLTITDNNNGTAGSTQTVALMGTGNNVSVSTNTLTFSAVTVGSSSTAQLVTLNNAGTTGLNIASIAVTGTNAGDFTQTNTCPVGSSLGAGLSCPINVTFTPTASGARTATLTITDDAGGVSPTTQTVSLTGTGAVNNTAQVSVNFGPLGATGGYYNGIFTTVTVCTPGSTTNCVTIPNVLVDTGSIGLRVLQSALGSVTLPQVTDSATGYPVYECVEYGDLSYTWGPMQMGTVQVGQETAVQVPASAGGTANAGIPIQVISSSGTPPTGIVYEGAAYYNPCTYSGSTPTNGIDDNTVANLGSNGIVGIRQLMVDCPGCTTINGVTGQYLEYDSAGITISGVGTFNYEAVATPVAYQAWNPIAAFPADNNGYSFQLPSLGSTGEAPTATGTITFGIGTQANNALPGSVTTYGLDCDADFLSATFNGVNYVDQETITVDGVEYPCSPVNSSFIDSGSNGLYVLDPTTLSAAPGVSMVDCSDNAGWYCPGSTQTLSLTLYGYNASTGLAGNPGTASISIGNADTLFSSGNAALSILGGPTIASGESTTYDYIDLGLPFFFGQTIYFGIAGATTGTPNLINGYWAF